MPDTGRARWAAAGGLAVNSVDVTWGVSGRVKSKLAGLRTTQDSRLAECDSLADAELSSFVETVSLGNVYSRFAQAFLQNKCRI